MSELESSISPIKEVQVPDSAPYTSSEVAVEGDAPVAKKVRLSKAEKRAAAEERRKQYWKSKVRRFLVLLRVYSSCFY